MTESAAGSHLPGQINTEFSYGKQRVSGNIQEPLTSQWFVE
jgi:hypothetical protein